jgi:REP element-mobilizing transposase RayT
MLQGFHVIFSTYGFWLPNDPRGSWSDWVRHWALLKFGPATKVDTRRSVAGAPHDRALRQAAKRALLYPEVHFTGSQALSVATGFRIAIAEADYAVHACSILPQHVHLVIGPSERNIRRIVAHLKARATQQLTREALHPLAEYRQPNGTVPSPWARNGWNVFIFSEAHLRDAIRYVQNNPLKEGKPQQHWSFVRPYVPNESHLGARSKLRR